MLVKINSSKVVFNSGYLLCIHGGRSKLYYPSDYFDGIALTDFVNISGYYENKESPIILLHYDSTSFTRYVYCELDGEICWCRKEVENADN
jgi:hypothetical protein